MLITFEGIEGSGKSTQVRLLQDVLTRQGHTVVATREPGGTAISDQIRTILLDARNSAMVSECELLLYYAARAQHVSQVILPALNSGGIVLCDRFTDATYAYQHFGRGLKSDILSVLDQFTLKDLRPNLTVLIDLPVETGLARAKSRAAALEVNAREERFENLKIEFHEKVRRGYLDLARKEPDRFLIVDGTLAPEVLHQRILDGVLQLWN